MGPARSSDISPTRPESRRGTIPAIAMGAISGALVTIALSRAVAPAPGRVAAAPVQVVPARAVQELPLVTRIRDERVEQRLGELERKLAEAETRSDAGTTVTTKIETEEPVPPAQRHQAWRKEHASEPREAAWATSEEATINRALMESGRDGGMSVVEVDCRTTSCRADVEWPTYGIAVERYRDVLRSAIPGCESAVLLEPPADSTRPYRTSAMFNCEPGRMESP